MRLVNCYRVRALAGSEMVSPPDKVFRSGGCDGVPERALAAGSAQREPFGWTHVEIVDVRTGERWYVPL